MLSKLIFGIIFAVSAWNAILACAVCHAFASYIWNIDPSWVRILMCVPVAYFVFFSTYRLLRSDLVR